MSTIKIKLVGCKRYNHLGELFEANKVYLVNESRGLGLLEQYDLWTGFPYFEKVEDPTIKAVTPEASVDDEGFKKEKVDPAAIPKKRGRPPKNRETADSLIVRTPEERADGVVPGKPSRGSNPIIEV